MRKAATILLLAISSYACNQAKSPVENQSALQQNNASGVVYGAAFTEGNVLPASALLAAIDNKDSLQATIAAEVVESCQAKGCWMDVKLTDNSNMKVTFKDYGFFLPVEDLEGREVIFTGTAKREVISVEDQQHYAKDAGKTAAEIAAITAPKEELRFVADGVILK
ncbi:DUF4920 domain-containing protein [Pontibacter rugosus]|uniref:DUF4920 domain-containing protein n=1 Tax=Pontibacter rugosus TaxID=1745966 RepID=A0ABW3SUE9_9BACT